MFLKFFIEQSRKQRLIERRIKQTMPAEVDCSRSNNIGSTAQQLGSTIEGQTANAVETRWVDTWKSLGDLYFISFLFLHSFLVVCFSVLYFVGFLLIFCFVFYYFLLFFPSLVLKYSHGIVESCHFAIKTWQRHIPNTNTMHPGHHGWMVEWLVGRNHQAYNKTKGKSIVIWF